MDICFDGMVYTGEMRRMYDWVIQEGGFNPRKVEFFPTSTRAIKLPLSIHNKTQRVCWYADKDTFELIEDEEYILSIQQMPVKDFLEIVGRLPAAAPAGAPRKAGNIAGRINARGPLPAWVGELPEVKERATRHNLMRSIAMGCIAEGVSKDTALAVLMKWYRDQVEKHPGLIASPEAEAERDAGKILDWVYGPGFNRTHNFREARPVSFTAKDAQMILEAPCGAARKAYFYIMAWCKMRGYSKISQRFLSTVLRKTVRAVRMAIDGLVKSGRVLRKPGKVRLEGEAFIRDSNTYFLPRAGPDGAAGSTAGEPQAAFEPEELNAPDRFDEIYWGVLLELIPREEMEGKMDWREKRELKELEESDKGVRQFAHFTGV